MRALLFLVAFSLVASFVVVGETAAQGTGAAQPATEFTLVGVQKGSSYYFTLEGQTEPNPTLVVPPNAKITITLKGGGGVHNIQVGDNPPSEYVNAPGDEVTYTFTSPASGTLEYFCVPHKSAKMGGKVQVAAAGGADAGAGDGQAAGNGTTAPPPPTEYVFNAHDEGGRFWWTVEGVKGTNPVVPIPPNTEITIRVRNAGSTTHNIQVQGGQPSEYVNAPGDEIVYKFTSPASGDVEYWCVPHKSAGMGKNFRVVVPGQEPAGGGAAEQETFTGPTVRLGDVLNDVPPQCADLQIPEASTSRIGGATPADYLKRCLNPQGDVEEAPGPHAADYVIPASWALIALGIVGVVWVHRSYKP